MSLSRRDALDGLIHSKHSWKLLDLFTFSLTEALAQAAEDGVIVDRRCLASSKV